MPGHFTHIYTARRVADLLASGEFNDWPPQVGDAIAHYDPEYCGRIMRRWEKFTAIGAIGPDLFYFSQDYNSSLIGPHSDEIMLALATYYFVDAAMEDDWEPLLIILDRVNGQMAAVLRLLIKLDRIWRKFVAAWNATVGPLVDAAGEILDDLTGGLISQAQVAISEFKDEIIILGEQELLTFKDIFSAFDTFVQKGWDEQSFLWSDMSHYRQTSAMCQALVGQAEALRGGEDGETRSEQFLAFALGYITHVGADVIGHSFVNAQCGGPYRNHPQRHHLIENHIDAWNYLNSKAGGRIPSDPWGSTVDYPDLSMSALWFAVQLTPDNPEGEQRPAPLPDDEQARKEALDVDGEMPLWMAESIVRAMQQAFEGHAHPTIYGGSEFQMTIDEGMLTKVIRSVTGDNIDQAFDELLAAIAPPPPFPVQRGFPLPWEIQTTYRVMISFFKFSYNGTWELQKPRQPDFIITPPASDFENLFQPPDFSGVDSANPIIDVCEIFIALFEWVVKELGAAVKLAGDLVKMAVSPFTYPLRKGLYELAMMAWDVTMKTHEVLAHTGYLIPHSEQRYEDGELRLPNEIDLPLITLGGSVDSAFLQALADAIDPFGNLDRNPDVIGIGHPVSDPRYPFYPVLRYHLKSNGDVERPPEPWEFRRPWAYPDVSIRTPDGSTNLPIPTPTEKILTNTNVAIVGSGALAGPYPAGTRPDQVFFRTDGPVSPAARALYEQAQSPHETDQLNVKYDQFEEAGIRGSPLGDPVPFSAYLIGQLANQVGYRAQFNLDSDRGFAYLTWDWDRGEATAQAGMDFDYRKPIEPPVDDKDWKLGEAFLRIHYVDPAPPAEPNGGGD